MSANQPQSLPRSQRRSQRPSINRRYAEQGFTLLEVLVAISIFAIIGLGANQMLRTVINTHDHTQASIKLYSEFSHAMAVMERDLSQAVPRGIRDEFGDYIIDNFVDEYIAGRTPNPCVLCNTHIKWEALLKRADQLGCKYIATGHYAQVREENGRYVILNVTFQLRKGESSLPITYAELAKHLSINIGDRAPVSDVKLLLIQPKFPPTYSVAPSNDVNLLCPQ